MSVDKLNAITKDVGGIPVARLLPQAGKRTIGAWCFLDHAGPSEFTDDNAGLQVGAHPHTNLQTFTWMLEGEVWHQDSLGYRQLIKPKQVNLMTAGTGNQRGISHTEQTPEGVHQLHAVQLWIALPMNQDIEPNFQHYPELPEWQENGVNYILTTGSYQGRTAPTQQYSPLVGVDIQFQQAQSITIEQQPNFEYGVLVLKGEVEIEGQVYQQDQLVSLTDCQAHEFKIKGEADSHIMLLGGEPLPHKTLVRWNFVADSQDALRQAIADWNNGHSRFGHIDLEGTRLRRLVAPEIPTRLAE
ncbi:pirin family protein [Avibacterium endocarditidis]|uniref:Pirin family protein n=1 Tax=Avibacterium endocarditidis TaxID=380674 RepID=A0ABX4ZT83_9PAST|nr:pirin family protein [Avibacterium endocarditidis]POY42734.1 pirin family protein [Avibacterium endocarditidis]